MAQGDEFSVSSPPPPPSGMPSSVQGDEFSSETPSAYGGPGGDNYPAPIFIPPMEVEKGNKLAIKIRIAIQNKHVSDDVYKALAYSGICGIYFEKAVQMIQAGEMRKDWYNYQNARNQSLTPRNYGNDPWSKAIKAGDEKRIQNLKQMTNDLQSDPQRCFAEAERFVQLGLKCLGCGGKGTMPPIASSSPPGAPIQPSDPSMPPLAPMRPQFGEPSAVPQGRTPFVPWTPTSASPWRPYQPRSDWPTSPWIPGTNSPWAPRSQPKQPAAPNTIPTKPPWPQWQQPTPQPLPTMPVQPEHPSAQQPQQPANSQRENPTTPPHRLHSPWTPINPTPLNTGQCNSSEIEEKLSQMLLRTKYQKHASPEGYSKCNMFVWDYLRETGQLPPGAPTTAPTVGKMVGFIKQHPDYFTEMHSPDQNWKNYKRRDNDVVLFLDPEHSGIVARTPGGDPGDKDLFYAGADEGRRRRTLGTAHSSLGVMIGLFGKGYVFRPRCR